MMSFTPKRGTGTPILTPTIFALARSGFGFISFYSLAGYIIQKFGDIESLDDRISPQFVGQIGLKNA